MRIDTMHLQMDEGKRIRQAYQVAGLTQSQLAEKLGVANTTVNRWVTEKNPAGAEAIRKIAEITGVNVEWLLTGIGTMFKPPRAAQPLPAIDYKAAVAGATEFDYAGKVEQKPVRSIPIFNIDAGPSVLYGDEGFAPGIADRWLQEYDGRDPNAFALHVRGDSMEPDIPKDYYCIVEPGSQVLPKDYVVFKAEVGSGLVCAIKQFFPMPDGSYRFHPANPAYYDIVIQPNELVYMYKIVKALRPFK